MLQGDKYTLQAREMKTNAEQNEHFPESVVIFGCGYVGTALAKCLVDRGLKVGALTRNPEKLEALRGLGVAEVVQADLDSRGWHARLSCDYQAVVNCVSSAGGGLAGYEKSYIEGQRSILQWCESCQVERYVYTSSTSVYPQDGGITVDESSSTDGAPATGEALLHSEQLIEEAGDLFSKWYVFRLAGIYGPGRHYLLNALREGAAVIPGRGDFHLNLIYLDDIVSALINGLWGSAPSGVYNLTDDQPGTKEELVNWLADQLKVPRPRFDPETQTSRLKRRGGRMPDRIVSNARARSHLGWRPRFPSFREGYAKLLLD